MTHCSHLTGDTLTLTSPRGKIVLSQGQCAAIVIMAEKNGPVGRVRPAHAAAERPAEVCAICGGTYEECQHRRCYGYVNGQRGPVDAGPALVKGDYVLATKYHDGCGSDWWGLGFFDRMEGARFMVVDVDGKQTRGNGYRRCERISRECGYWLWGQRAEIETFGSDIWIMVAEYNKTRSATPADDAAGPVGRVLFQAMESMTDAQKLAGAMACIASQERIAEAKDKQIAALRAEVEAVQLDTRVSAATNAHACAERDEARRRIGELERNLAASSAVTDSFVAEVKRLGAVLKTTNRELDEARAERGCTIPERDRLAAELAAALKAKAETETELAAMKAQKVAYAGISTDDGVEIWNSNGTARDCILRLHRRGFMDCVKAAGIEVDG